MDKSNEIPIRIWTMPGCSRSRRLKKWCRENDMPYQEETVFGLLMEEEKLMALLEQAAKPEWVADLEGCPSRDLQQIARWIAENPSAIRRPLVLVGKEVLTPEAWRALGHYLSREENIDCQTCPLYPVCAGLRQLDRAALILEKGSHLLLEEAGYPDVSDSFNAGENEE